MDYNFDLEDNIYYSAIEMAKEAGQFIKSRIGDTGIISEKGNFTDLVTEVDRYSEELIWKRIQSQFPNHWILSEEDCGKNNPYNFIKKNKVGYGWIIDPIDGTTNFIQGIGHFSVSIGVVKDGEIVIGIVYNPVTSELFTARKSQGAYLNDKPIQVGHETKMKDIVISSGFNVADFFAGSQLIRQMDVLAGHTRDIRIFGAASLDLCLVASGKVGAFWHDGLKPWDTAAGVLILIEAGGKVTNIKGEKYELFHDTMVATNGKIHEQFLGTITF